MKQKLIKLISCILVLAIVLAMTPITAFSATEFLDNEAQVIEDARQDSMMPTSAGDWTQAKNDGFWWNSFHNAVQGHIRDEQGGNDGIQPHELSVTFKDNGRRGRADLYRIDRNEDDNTEIYYIWEVKPASFSVPPKDAQGEIQLVRYINSTSVPGVTHKRGDSFIQDGNFEMESATTGAVYRVTYRNNGNGFIFYWFERQAEEDPEKSPVRVPGNAHIGAPGFDPRRARQDLEDYVSNLGSGNHEIPPGGSRNLAERKGGSDS